MAINLSIGDVFRFAGPDNDWACGQILYTDTLQFIVVFEPRFTNLTNIEDVTKSRPLLAGWTMDGRFCSGAWEKLGNVEPVSNIMLPNYKIGIEGKTWVVDFTGKPLRLASAEEEECLTFRKSYSPMIYENVFKAYHGYVPWESRFEGLRAKLLDS